MENISEEGDIRTDNSSVNNEEIEIRQIGDDTTDMHLLETISILIKEQFDYIEELENVNFNKTLIMENLKSAIEYNKLLKETTEKLLFERDGKINEMYNIIKDLLQEQQKDIEDKKILCKEILVLENEKKNIIYQKLSSKEMKNYLLKRDNIVKILEDKLKMMIKEKNEIEQAKRELSIEARNELDKVLRKINHGIRVTNFLNSTTIQIENNVENIQKELNDLKKSISDKKII